MKDKRILYVSSEVIPYLPQTEISSMSFEAPKMVNKQGGQIRIFMPRYGNINERRHQLHEVIRLSGINLVVNDLDILVLLHRNIDKHEAYINLTYRLSHVFDISSLVCK